MTISTPPTQQGTQTSEKEEIWSTILKGVASSKMVPSKKILVLGDPGSGKSTLIHYLKNDPGPQAIQNDNDEVPTATNAPFSISSRPNYIPVDNHDDDDATNTLALGYSFIDIQDEDNEAIARLGVYQLGLSAAEYMPLLKFALSTETLADSAVIIVLDWTRPWEFLESLQRWIDVLQRRIDEICKEGSAGETWSRGKAVVDELREKVEHYMQTYTEPVPNTAFNLTASTSTGSVPSTPTAFTTPLVTTTTSADQVTLPLTQGALTNNLGIPLIVVCCKSDAQITLEQTLDYKDEQFDFIQQTLRCVCMKYGAALLYTSTLQPYTYHNLRQYIIHRLLTTSTKAYPFQLKAQVVERDAVLVPAGWDSWGKLRVLREGFDCEAVHQGWDSDMDAVADRQQPGFHGARGNYEEVIADPNSKEQPLSNIPPPVTCEDEQVFLERHFDTLQHGTELPGRKGTGAPSITKPSVVGPLGVSSATIDLMRSGEDRRLKDSPLDAIKMASNTTNVTSNKTTTMTAPSTTPGTTTSALPSMDTNLNNPIGGVNQPGGPSHEVLANFFQSLLVKKASSSSGGASSPTTLLGNSTLGSREGSSEDMTTSTNTTATTNTTNTTTSPSSGTTRRPTISRKDVHKELDRMRQYVNKQ
ncbi:dynein light intermediate chain-domain-containing protein [Gilbertella persicaria]|uniref:dynein light intermediate chain-domain-containing protein n=1 Tax=Gilbertella persicaria TaxID=101096 RepID=UPI00222083E9|nr:dynein light intermediate chain-domain-containing protein [Gilbertella persicaria]KAI8058955.1 dynein light intermediate chain-domain-containing protein [Gilbertella persicaria]